MSKTTHLFERFEKKRVGAKKSSNQRFHYMTRTTRITIVLEVSILVSQKNELWAFFASNRIFFTQNCEGHNARYYVICDERTPSEPSFHKFGSWFVTFLILFFAFETDCLWHLKIELSNLHPKLGCTHARASLESYLCVTFWIRAFTGKKN